MVCFFCFAFLLLAFAFCFFFHVLFLVIQLEGVQGCAIYSPATALEVSLFLPLAAGVAPSIGLLLMLSFGFHVSFRFVYLHLLLFSLSIPFAFTRLCCLEESFSFPATVETVKYSTVMVFPLCGFNAPARAISLSNSFHVYSFDLANRVAPSTGHFVSGTLLPLSWNFHLLFMSLYDPSFFVWFILQLLFLLACPVPLQHLLHVVTDCWRFLSFSCIYAPLMVEMGLCHVAPSIGGMEPLETSGSTAIQYNPTHVLVNLYGNNDPPLWPRCCCRSLCTSQRILYHSISVSLLFDRLCKRTNKQTTKQMMIVDSQFG